MNIVRFLLNACGRIHNASPPRRQRESAMRPIVIALLLALAAPVPARASFLEFLEAKIDGADGVDGLQKAQDAVVSPDGLNLYAVSEGDSAIVTFARDAATGTLAFQDILRDGVGGIDGLASSADVAVSPDGANVYVTGAADNAIAIFARDAATGALAFVEQVKNGVDGVQGLSIPEDLVVSPDGSNVYVAAFGNQSVLSFARDTVSGKLAFLGRLSNGVGGTSNVSFPSGMVISPDGLHVYVSCSGSDSVAVFARTGASGALTFVESQTAGVGGVTGIEGTFELAISPDGRHLYVGGADNDTLAIFARDAATGTLQFIESLQDGVGGIDGLDFPSDLQVSPCGARVYVTGFSDNSLAVFDRDPATGTLTVLEIVRDGIGGAQGLVGANTVVLSPDGASVYTTARTSNAVAAFRLAVAPATTSTTTTTTSTSTTTTLPGCAPAPAAGCVAPGGASFTLEIGAKPERDNLAFSWRETPISVATFGDPTTTTGVRLCVYASGDLVLDALAPAAGTCGGTPCWVATGTTGFRYTDPGATSGGLRRIVLRAGTNPKITVKGKGARLTP